MNKDIKRDPRSLKSLDDFLKEEGIFQETTDAAQARVAILAEKDQENSSRGKDILEKIMAARVFGDWWSDFDVLPAIKTAKLYLEDVSTSPTIYEQLLTRIVEAQRVDDDKHIPVAVLGDVYQILLTSKTIIKLDQKPLNATAIKKKREEHPKDLKFDSDTGKLIE